MKTRKTYKAATKALLMAALLSFSFVWAHAGIPPASADSASSYPPSRRIIHGMGVEARAAYIHENKLPKDAYGMWSPGGRSFSAHLKYSFRFHPNTLAGRTYPGAYQGIGTAWFAFEEGSVMGNPAAVYLFQGAHIARISPRLSFDYEWNFGLSGPWKPYDMDDHNTNWVIGSKVNAYINANFFLNYTISPRLSATAGIALTHFSNGNTRFPNAGLNTIGARLGLNYAFDSGGNKLTHRSDAPPFPRHMSYDVVLFGSWRKRGILIDNTPHILPDVYPVLGFSIAPMYNLHHNLRVGAAIDGFYDSSANLIPEDYIVDENSSELPLVDPGVKKQIALGLSGRVEFAMPYFTIGLGLGANVLHGGGDMKSTYQILSLKIELFRNSFVHVGYSLRNFCEPNFLMLGIGFRFNDKSPGLYR